MINSKKRPSSKAKRPVGRNSGKKQKSILSFFNKQSTTSPVPRPKTTLSPKIQNTPSTAASLDRTAPPAPAPEKIVHDPKDGLSRELFTDVADDESPVRPVKRRRLIKLSDFSDDESDQVAPSAKVGGKKDADDEPILSSGRKRGLLAKKKRAADDDEAWSAGSGREEMNDEDDVMPEDECMDDGEKDNEEKTPAKDGKGDHELMEGTYDFNSMLCPQRTDAAPPADDTSDPSSKELRKAKKRLSMLETADRAVGNESGGWCEKHKWAVDIRDSQKRRPTDPGYDKSKLYIPPHELTDAYRGKSSKSSGVLSPFQKQFWRIKKDNYDVLIFFKKGKFYELYDIDADIGHQQLGLNFTRGGRVDMRCCGVPEQSFDKHCARLIDLGHKVGRVEQTETANAAEMRQRGGTNKSAVCERSLVRILTKATVTDDGLLRDHRARYVLAITERAGPTKIPDSDQSTSVEDEDIGTEENAVHTIGVCYVDVASGNINIGEYDDDFRLAKTERLITFLHPQEIVINMSESSRRLSNIVQWTKNKSDSEVIDTGLKGGFETMNDTILGKYLNSESEDEKKEFNRVHNHLEKHGLSCVAFGWMASHLKSLIIDQETLSIGNYNLFPDPSQQDLADGGMQDSVPLPVTSSARLSMDAPTLENLEVLSSTVDASERGALLSFVDRAMTAAGRRLIRKWIAEPLVSSSDIEDRLQSIEDIHKMEDGDGGRLLNNVVKQLKTKKDLERALPKLHQQAIARSEAVMFDDTNKRRVREFLDILRSLKKCLSGLAALRKAAAVGNIQSKRLKWLCAIGCGVPADAREKLEYFFGDAFDWKHAEESGEILPKAGAVPSYDECDKRLKEVEANFEDELRKWKKRLNDHSIKFYHRGKEPYQLEIKFTTIKGNIPQEFELASESKIMKRFYTHRLKSLVKEHVGASEAYDDAASSVAKDMMQQFDKQFATWSAISTACAEIDALVGLAYASRDEGSGPMCRPTILPNNHPEPVFKAEGLRHPILASKSEGFVSNNVKLGAGEAPEIMILTGPNAGGKSTLARQVALSVILAQLGCFVPAKSFCIRPFENIFVRMGASDDLARGRSTFMVEMEEVGNILNNANSKSLIIADEVGRGTSTHDGYAVAYASLDHIAKVNKSLTVFSTHYSHLGEDIVALGKKDGRVGAALFEMGAVIDAVSKKITFLYKLQPGSSGDSRGIYCARVAGIPASIADSAEQASERFDEALALRLAATKFDRLSKGLVSDEKKALVALQQQR